LDRQVFRHGLPSPIQDAEGHVPRVGQSHPSTLSSKIKARKCPPVDCPKAVLIALYYLAHELSMDDVADKFGVTGSTVHKEVHRIVDLA